MMTGGFWMMPAFFLIALGVIILLFVLLRRSAGPDVTELEEKLEKITSELNRLLQEQTGRIVENIGRVRDESRISISDSFTKTQKELNESLAAGRKELAESLSASQKLLSEKLENLLKETTNIRAVSAGMLEVGKDIRQLSDILEGGQTRGGFGEFQLGLILKEVIPAERYREQYRIGDGVVDAAIFLKDRILCIDSKFPLANLKKSYDAEGEESARFRQAFFADVKNRAREIGRKYIVPEKTLDFAVMFIPSEAVFLEIVSNSELHKKLIDMRVIPASPNFLYVYFQALAIGFRGLAVEAEAEKIIRTISSLRVGFEKFQDNFRLVGRHLENAIKQYNETERQFERLDSTLGNLEAGRGDDRPQEDA
jgi:DNA recombination protein RmuC